jgi:hypothetical protein
VKLLVVAAGHDTRRMLQKLAARGRVEIEWREFDDDLARSAMDCAAVLIDGDAARRPEAAPALERMARLSRRRPRVPVLLLSRLGDRRAGRGCGLSRQDGVLHAHCRLRSLAWAEAEALLADALQRETLEPVTFEYQG